MLLYCAIGKEDFLDMFNGEILLPSKSSSGGSDFIEESLDSKD